MAKNPQAAFTFLTWLSGYGSTSTIAKLLPKGGWIPAGPAPAAAPAYKAWLNTNSYVKPLVDVLASKHSQQVALTPAESEYETAVTQATQLLATKKMTPEQALTYIDKQANAALHKKEGGESVLGDNGEHLGPVVGDDEGVLELGGALGV